jgi:hypothetical protein
MGRLLIVAGVVLVALGVLVTWGFPLGRLPGDVVIRRDGLTIYLPVTTCLLLGVILTLVVRALGR